MIIPRLEAIIVCLNYSDFLAETLPLNMQYFDDVIVVTGHDDKETQKVCERNSVEHVVTDDFFREGDTFNKGRAINIGRSNLPQKGWILHLDSDIVLPHRYRDMLRKTQLRQECIYGADRVNVYGWDAWQEVKKHLVPHFQDNWYLDPGFCHKQNGPTAAQQKFGARVIHKEIGWVPLGFHQLFHASAKPRYSYMLGSAAGSDIFFPAQWPRKNRILLPEVVCYHLDSDATHTKGVNWRGRKSPYFGPKNCPQCGQPMDRCHCRKHHHHPYCSNSVQGKHQIIEDDQNDN